MGSDIVVYFVFNLEPSSTMHPMLNTAVTAARSAGRIIVRYIDRIDSLTITAKARNDFVSEVDQYAENEIIQKLSRAYPEHGILAEESGEKKGNDYQWIIDPLDGTTNFLYGIPHYAVSIALANRGRLEQAVIYDPAKDELFTASRGQGAHMNGRRLRVNNRRDLHGALLATGIPFREDQDLELFLETMRLLIPDTAGIRRPGAASLDFAYVAAGRLDGFWEFSLKPWDIAAGALLVEEAGGRVADLRGGEDPLVSGNVICGSPRVFQAMQERLKQVKGLAEKKPDKPASVNPWKQ